MATLTADNLDQGLRREGLSAKLFVQERLRACNHDEAAQSNPASSQKPSNQKHADNWRKRWSINAVYSSTVSYSRGAHRGASCTFYASELVLVARSPKAPVRTGKPTLSASLWFFKQPLSELPRFSRAPGGKESLRAVSSPSI